VHGEKNSGATPGKKIRRGAFPRGVAAVAVSAVAARYVQSDGRVSAVAWAVLRGRRLTDGVVTRVQPMMIL
jgi:hypothetical protein